MLLLSKYFKTSIQLVVCLFLFKNAQSQNLIINESFEDYTSPVNCSGGSGGFDNYSVFPVNHVVDYWYSLNSSDYFSSLCSGVNNDGSPINIFGISQPKQGANYAGFILFQANGDMKEYIYQHLSSPLQAGKIYCLSFYVSKADRITHAIKNIGAYFSVSTPSLFSNLYVNAVPQVVNQSSFISDTIGWTEIQGCFTANGGEQYITIGNFNSNTNTDTVFVGTNNQVFGANGYAYYYIDDVTLIDQTTVGVNDVYKENSFEIYPNPNNGVMQFTYNITKKAEFTITDINSRIVNTYLLEEGEQNIAIKEQDLKEGLYFYSVKQNNIVLKRDKFVILK